MVVTHVTHRGSSRRPSQVHVRSYTSAGSEMFVTVTAANKAHHCEHRPLGRSMHEVIKGGLAAVHHHPAPAQVRGQACIAAVHHHRAPAQVRGQASLAAVHHHPAPTQVRGQACLAAVHHHPAPAQVRGQACY